VVPQKMTTPISKNGIIVKDGTSILASGSLKTSTEIKHVYFRVYADELGNAPTITESGIGYGPSSIDSKWTNISNGELIIKSTKEGSYYITTINSQNIKGIDSTWKNVIVKFAAKNTEEAVADDFYYYFSNKLPM